MKLKIDHTTIYTYDAPISYALQQVRLTPTDNPLQKVINWSVVAEGGRIELEFCDQHRNQTLLVQTDPDRTELRLTARGEVETNDLQGILGKTYGTAPLWYFMRQTPRTLPGKGIRAMTRLLDQADDQLAGLHSLSASILDAAPYRKTTTLAQTTAEEALQAGGGVCQDHSQIFISVAREAGIPARYVSGYLMMDDRIDQEASHAWAEACVDGLGWVGFDVSNGISPDERYVRLATGLDSLDAAPVKGMRLGNAQESMIVSLQIQQ